MDHLSVIASSRVVTSLATDLVKTLRSTRHQYVNVDRSIRLLNFQVTSFRTISESLHLVLERRNNSSGDLEAQVAAVLEGCQPLIVQIGDHITRVAKNSAQNESNTKTGVARLGFLAKARHILAKDELEVYREELKYQCDTLSLLLHSLTLTSDSEGHSRLTTEERQSIFSRIRYASSSLLLLRGSMSKSNRSSINSCTSIASFSKRFNFDSRLFTSNVYRRVLEPTRNTVQQCSFISTPGEDTSVDNLPELIHDSETSSDDDDPALRAQDVTPVDIKTTLFSEKTEGPELNYNTESFSDDDASTIRIGMVIPLDVQPTLLTEEVNSEPISQHVPIYLSALPDFPISNDTVSLTVEKSTPNVLQSLGSKLGKLDRQLLAAAWEGRSREVRTLLHQGVNPNGGARTRYRYSALHLAVAKTRSSTIIIQFLVKHGADLDAKSVHNSTPLHIASTLANVNNVRKLLHHNAAIDIRDQSGATPLLAAIRLIGTSLEATQIQERAEVIRMLLEAGADPNIQDELGLGAIDILSQKLEELRRKAPVRLGNAVPPFQAGLWARYVEIVHIFSQLLCHGISYHSIPDDSLVENPVYLPFWHAAFSRHFHNHCFGLMDDKQIERWIARCYCGESGNTVYASKNEEQFEDYIPSTTSFEDALVSFTNHVSQDTSFSSENWEVPGSIHDVTIALSFLERHIYNDLR